MFSTYDTEMGVLDFRTPYKGESERYGVNQLKWICHFTLSQFLCYLQILYYLP